MTKFSDINESDIELLEHVKRGLERQIKRLRGSRRANVAYPRTQEGYNELLELITTANEARTALQEMENVEGSMRRSYSRRVRKPITERTP